MVKCMQLLYWSVCEPCGWAKLYDSLEVADDKLQLHKAYGCYAGGCHSCDAPKKGAV